MQAERFLRYAFLMFTRIAFLFFVLSPPVFAEQTQGQAGSREQTSPFAETPALESRNIDPDDIGMDALDEDALPSWIDESHAKATSRAQALAQWTDSFFGAASQDTERADTFVRVIVADQWDRADGHDPKFRLRGQVKLPAISNRIDLVFAGSDTENLAGEDSASRSEEAGLRFNFRNNPKLRVDATLGITSGPGVIPGIRLRYQDDLTDDTWYRVSQRLQYDTGRGNRAITEFGLNHFAGEGRLLRWNARARYREDKKFWDWRTSLVYRQWFQDHEKFPSAVEYFVGWGGRDVPELFTTNFRIGATFRKQWLRPFLYFEIEPNYALRKDTFEEKRKWVPGLSLRLEVMLDDDLMR
jgi:hypothetical protein